MNELYVNNTLLDLPTDSLIALSYAVNTLTDLKSVQGNISNSINLPNTANNRAALGYPDDMNFNGAAIIRTKLACRFIQNGIEIIANGFLRIIGAAKNQINVVISSGNTDFFDLLTGKLRDLDFGIYDHIWNMDNVMASRTNNDGYIYPWINYGNLSNDTGDIHGQGISPNEMRPAMFAKTVVSKICDSIGYSLINHIADDTVTNTIYDKLLLPFSSDKFVHSNRYSNFYNLQNVSVQQTNQLDYLGYFRGTKIGIPFNNIVSDVGGLFDGTHWTAPRIMTIDIDVAFPHIFIHREYATLDNYNGLYMKIYKTPAGVDPSDMNSFYADAYKIYEPDHLGFGGADGDANFYNFKMQLKGITVNTGDRITIAFETAGRIADNPLSHNGPIDVHFYVTPELNIKLNSDNMIFGESVQVESVLPDMSTLDFMKFISFLFCAIIQTDNVAKTVTIVPFGYITQNIRNAIDWSDKVTNGDESYDVTIGDYAQQNEAKWKHDDNVSPDTYANWSFTIVDDNLDVYKDIYDIPFAASFECPVMGNYITSLISKIPDYNATPGVNGLEFTTTTEQRILLLAKRDVNAIYRWGTDLTHAVSDNIPFTFFASPSSAPDLTMKSIFANHYKELITVLNDQRKLTCYLMLNETDIQQLDFFKPVYIAKYQRYFYISKITDFTGLKPCKVELIKLL